ncbi:hypothetical protein RSOLAG22IIIB_10226 [Rhizoctonia solani]|uniref:Uncharacterized protein n=1 Tax=Rhizoctonia solani TaxID=456999 RepID=A0A0K6G2F8_9AGAM|nr:hypothetical protein RSOLAG22IIIB_10226 [Rhizoctonia solani]
MDGTILPTVRHSGSNREQKKLAHTMPFIQYRFPLSLLVAHWYMFARTFVRVPLVHGPLLSSAAFSEFNGGKVRVLLPVA